MPIAHMMALDMVSLPASIIIIIMMLCIQPGSLGVILILESGAICRVLPTLEVHILAVGRYNLYTMLFCKGHIHVGGSPSEEVNCEDQ